MAQHSNDMQRVGLLQPQACFKSGSQAAVDQRSCRHHLLTNNLKTLDTSTVQSVLCSQVLLSFSTAMIPQETDQMSGGWPLGLEIVSLRLRQAPPPAAPTPPVFLRFPSTSLSCASSSNFETESKISSFFEDHSVTLGRLIGIRQRSTAAIEQHHLRHATASNRRGALHSKDEAAGSRGSCGGLVERYEGICVPLLAGILDKMNPAAA